MKATCITIINYYIIIINLSSLFFEVKKVKLNITIFLFFFSDVDDWCNARDSDEFPESLKTAPPPVESKTTVKSAAYSLHFWSIFLTFLPLQLYYFFF